MSTVNMHEAKTNLSKLVEAVENGRESEVIISRNGKPAARLVPLSDSKAPKRKARRLGIAEGEFDLDFEAFQALDEVVWRGVLDEPVFPPSRTGEAAAAPRKAKKPA
jgi:prevent-host-death family protein